MDDHARLERRWSYVAWLIRTDLHRYAGRHDLRAMLAHLWGTPGFICTFWYRICRFLRLRRGWRLALFPFARFFYFHAQHKYGISLPFETRIGPGFYIGHFGGIFLNGLSVLGRDVNISQDVTMGRVVKDGTAGAAVLGDRVYVGPGAKIVGAVRLGDDVAVGANCVVTRDAPDKAVVAGVPGRVISEGKGSAGYINRTDYPDYRG